MRHVRGTLNLPRPPGPVNGPGDSLFGQGKSSIDQGAPERYSLFVIETVPSPAALTTPAAYSIVVTDELGATTTTMTSDWNEVLSAVYDVNDNMTQFVSRDISDTGTFFCEDACYDRRIVITKLPLGPIAPRRVVAPAKVAIESFTLVSLIDGDVDLTVFATMEEVIDQLGEIIDDWDNCDEFDSLEEIAAEFARCAEVIVPCHDWSWTYTITRHRTLYTA